MFSVDTLKVVLSLMDYNVFFLFVFFCHPYPTFHWGLDFAVYLSSEHIILYVTLHPAAFLLQT